MVVYRYWYAGTPVWWFAGTPVCRYTDTLVCWYTGTLVHWYTDTEVCWCWVFYPVPLSDAGKRGYVSKFAFSMKSLPRAGVLRIVIKTYNRLTFIAWSCHIQAGVKQIN